MASDVSPSRLHGLLLSDPRIDQRSLWSQAAAGASYSQASPRPGVPEAQGVYSAVMESCGIQAAGKALRVRGLVAGHPAPTGLGGSVVWQYDGDSAWRGWDPPNCASDWEAVVYTDVAGQIRTPHMIGLRNGTLLCAYQNGASKVSVRSKTPTGSWSGAVDVFTAASAPANGLYPCLVLLPDDSVLCFHWVEDAKTLEMQIRTWRSQDDGASWTLVTDHALVEWAETVGWTGGVRKAWDYSGAAGVGAAGYVPGRLRAAYSNGTVLLLAGATLHNTTPTYRNVLVAFTSTDLGGHFVHTETTDPAAWGVAYHDVLIVNDRPLVAYCDVGTTFAKVRKLDWPTGSLDAATAVMCTDGVGVAVCTTAAGAVVDGDMAACLDDGGTVYLVARRPASWQTIVLRSQDAGTTWAMVGQSSVVGTLSMVVYSRSAQVYLRGYSAVARWGEVVVAHQWESETGTYDDSLAMLHLGGSTTATMPGRKKFSIDLDAVSWEYWYSGAIETPANTGWAAVGGGVDAFTATGREVSTIADQRHFSIAPTGTETEGITVKVRGLSVSINGSLVTDDVALLVQPSGTNEYSVSIRATGTTLRAWDNVAGVQVGSDATAPVASGVDLFVSVGGTGTITAWWRPTGPSHDNAWTLWLNAAAVGSRVATASLVRWGHIAVSTAQSRWKQVKVANDDWNGLGLHAGQANPSALRGRAVSLAGTYLDGGTGVQCLRGPIRNGDVWHVDTRYEYAIERIFPQVHRSPRVGWRSVVDDVEQRIPIVIDRALLGSAESELGCDLVGLHLSGINWRTGQIQYYDVDTAAWITIATLDAATGRTAMSFIRRGATVVPNDDTSAFNAFADEWRGATFELSATKKRRVAWHAEGRWQDDYPGRKLHLHLDGIDGTEPGGSAVGRLWSSQYTCLVNVLGVRAAAWRLVIDAQTTVDGYYTIGKLVVGPVSVWTTPYDWTRASQSERGWTRTETDDRVGYLVRRAPDRIQTRIAWAEAGVDQTQLFGASPDYVTTSETAGAVAVGARHGTPMEVFGMAALTRGAPVVYLPRIPRSVGGAGTDVIHLTRRDEQLYGWLDSDIEVETVQGWEADATEGEVVRVQTVAIRGEV